MKRLAGWGVSAGQVCNVGGTGRHRAGVQFFRSTHMLLLVDANADYVLLLLLVA